VLLEILLGSLQPHQRIARHTRVLEHEGFVEQLEALDIVDGALRGLDAVEDDKGLALALEAALGHHVQHGAELAEERVECRHECFRLDALVDVADLGDFFC
jgi:hypothetical protein